MLPALPIIPQAVSAKYGATNSTSSVQVVGFLAPLVPQVSSPALGISGDPTPEDHDLECCGEYGFCAGVCNDYPMYFCNEDRSVVAPKAKMDFGFCAACRPNKRTSLDKVEILGTKASFHHNGPSCCWCCAPSTITVQNAGRDVGFVNYNPRPLCSYCCDAEFKSMVATDTTGNVKFQRVEHGCLDGGRLTETSCFGFCEKTWPIHNAAGTEVGGLSHRVAPGCPFLRPTWMGYKEWPKMSETQCPTAKQDEQLLLMGIALMHWVNRFHNQKSGKKMQ